MDRVANDGDTTGGKWWLTGDDVKAAVANGAQIRGRQRQGMTLGQRWLTELGSIEGITGEVKVGEARLRMAREKLDEVVVMERGEGDDARDGGRAEVENGEGGWEVGTELVGKGVGDEERSDGGDEDSEEDEGVEGLAIEEGATEDDERGAAPSVRKTTVSMEGDLERR